MGQVQLDTKIKFKSNYFFNISCRFFLKQIYYHIPVKGELWNSIVVFLYKLVTILRDWSLIMGRGGGYKTGGGCT